MNYSNIRITLDMQRACSGVSIQVKKKDIGRKIYITLMDDGIPYSITDGCVAAFTAKKPDDKIVYEECEISGNTIAYEVAAQVAAVPGRHECEMKLYGADGKLLTSSCFDIIVDDTVYEDGDEVEPPTKPTKVMFAPSGFKVDQLLQVAEVSEDGTIVRLKGADNVGGDTALLIVTLTKVEGEDYYLASHSSEEIAQWTFDGGAVVLVNDGLVYQPYLLPYPGDGSSASFIFVRWFQDKATAYGYSITPEYPDIGNVALPIRETFEFAPNVDAVSPTAVVSQTSDGATITITDKDGTTSATIKNGEDGQPGAKGDKGDTGAPGADGKDGNDYVLTDADKEEIAEQAAALVPTGGGSADWNAAEGEPGYVENRTHWAERYEATVECAAGEQASLENFPAFAAGDTVTVKVDGVEHSLVAFDDAGAVMVVPDDWSWALAYSPVDDTAVFMPFASNQTITYEAEAVHKLDEKFLPRIKTPVMVVTTNLDRTMASPTPQKIYDYAQAGGNVVWEYSGELIPLTGYGTGFAWFTRISLEEGLAIQLCVSDDGSAEVFESSFG